MRQKYKLFKVINVFDIVLIILCAVVVYGAYVLSMPQEVIAAEGRTVRFTLEFSDRPTGFHEGISEGPLVVESSRGTAIGHVVYAYGLPFLQDVPDEANLRINRTPVEGREFTYVVVETTANVSDLETEVNQIRLVVNREIYVRSRDFAGLAFITAVEWID